MESSRKNHLQKTTTAKGRRSRHSFPFSYGERSAKKNRDNIKLLTSYPVFQAEVKLARAHLGIPEGGFADDDTSRAWQEAADKRMDEIMDSKEFNDQLRAIDGKRRSGEIGHRTAETQSALLHLKLPFNYLTHVSKFLTEKFDVPQNYSGFIRHYILFNNSWPIPGSNFEVAFYAPELDSKKKRYVTVNIYARLDDDELRELKHQVEYWGARLPKFQALKNIDKKLTIEEWFTNRQRHDAVEDRPYRITPGEIALDLLGSKRKGKQVYDAVRTLKTLRQRRFGKQQ